MESAASFQPPPRAAHLHTWERAVIWLVLALATFGLFGFPYAAGTTWALVLELTRVGALPATGFIPPIVLFVGAVLLTLRRRVATWWIAVHIPLAIGYLAVRYGLGSISPLWWLGYACEAAIVVFCWRLAKRGALR